MEGEVKMVTKKDLIKKPFQIAKKIANSNPHTKRFAQKLKKQVFQFVEDRNRREIYNVSSFYPTITEYYYQQKDSKGKDPLISILLPTYNTPEVFLRECIDSIVTQSYANWELCIADDNSPDPRTVEIIKEYQKLDKRIKLVERKENGHISLATNSALEIAKGEFVALMDHDDVLWPNALYEMIQVIRKNPKVDLIYSDEDKIDGTGKIHSYPFLKPKFSPEFLESCNYITHFSCIRTSLMNEIKGFRKGYEGAQDWDLFIRIGEKTNNIIHLPKIIYSWRIHEGSTASDTDAKPYVYEAQLKLLEDHVSRQGKKAEVVTGIIRQHRTVKYEPTKGSSLTVVVKGSDTTDVIKTLQSIEGVAAGAPYDIVVVGDVASADEYKASSSSAKSVKVVAKLAASDIDKSGSTILEIKAGVVIISEGWARLALADSQIDGVAIVYPVIFGDDRATILAAGYGIGYGETGVEPMLKGMPLQDDHYTRGLYAKSRRNISAGSNVAFVTSRALYRDKIVDTEDFIGLNLALLKDGKRHIYSPYIQVVSSEALEAQTGPYENHSDEYLNDSFEKSNGRMEVKA